MHSDGISPPDDAAIAELAGDRSAGEGASLPSQDSAVEVEMIPEPEPEYLDGFLLEELRDCVANMRAITEAALRWCQTNQTKFLPGDLMVLSNHLGNPLTLVCPAHKEESLKRMAWEDFGPEYISYRVHPSVVRQYPWSSQTNNAHLFIHCPVHRYWVFLPGRSVQILSRPSFGPRVPEE